MEFAFRFLFVLICFGIGDMNAVAEFVKIFVYGTLKPGQVNYHWCASKVIKCCDAAIKGKLFHLDAGYPAVCEGTDDVFGNILYLADGDIVADLDLLEGFSEHAIDTDNLYNRKIVTANPVDGSGSESVYVYFMSEDRIRQQNGKYIQAGVWPSPLFQSDYCGDEVD